MRNVVAFLPFASEAELRFARAIARLGQVRLLGVCGRLPERASDRALFHEIVRIHDPLDGERLIEAIDGLRKRHGSFEHIVGTLEATMVQLAEAREHFGVLAGTRARVAERFRDKAKMKQCLRAAGVPVARHRVITCVEDARVFVGEVGLPIVIKPLAGVGSVATCRVRTIPELLGALGAMGVSRARPLLGEEMLEGAEHTYETVTLGGAPVAGSFSRYLPNCLEALENPWMQWAVLLPREVVTPLYTEAARIGARVIEALGLDRAMTHMEFFERPAGDATGRLVVGEIAQRPPGPQLCQMTGLVHDIDIYEAWARLEIDGVFEQKWERKYAAGTAFVRGVGRGRVVGVRGIRETHAAIGSSLVEAKLPEIGRPKNASYEGDGYVVVRHESTEKVREMLGAIVNNVRVLYA